MTDYLRQELRRSVAARQAAIVTGAGVSIQATDGRPDASWIGLLESGVDRCCDIRPDLGGSWSDTVLSDINSSSLAQRVHAAQDIQQALQNLPGNHFRKWLRDTVGSFTAVETGLIKAIVGLNIPIVTTNYDDILTCALNARYKIQAPRPAITWRDPSAIQRVMRQEETGVIHIHGHWTDPSSIVLGVKSYREVMGDRSSQDIMKTIFASTSVIFVGFGAGLQDPNFSGLRDWVSEVLKSSDYPPTVLVRQDELASVRRLYEDDGFQVLQYGDSYADLELFIADLCPSVSVQLAPRYYDWDTVSGMLRRLHYRIHRQFSPDAVISMSGPGAAAASYCLSLDPSETPLLTAVTFPRNEGRSPKNTSFHLIAQQSDWVHIETDSWDMYLPNVLARLPQNASVLLFDDKVNSGASQRKVQTFLSSLGLTVKRAALVINSRVQDEVDWYEEVNDGDYFFPWGNRRGRAGVS
jgi:hypothetical protein